MAKSNDSDKKEEKRLMLRFDNDVVRARYIQRVTKEDVDANEDDDTPTYNIILNKTEIAVNPYANIILPYKSRIIRDEKYESLLLQLKKNDIDIINI